MKMKEMITKDYGTYHDQFSTELQDWFNITIRLSYATEDNIASLKQAIETWARNLDKSNPYTQRPNLKSIKVYTGDKHNVNILYILFRERMRYTRTPPAAYALRIIHDYGAPGRYCVRCEGDAEWYFERFHGRYGTSPFDEPAWRAFGERFPGLLDVIRDEALKMPATVLTGAPYGGKCPSCKQDLHQNEDGDWVCPNGLPETCFNTLQRKAREIHLHRNTPKGEMPNGRLRGDRIGQEPHRECGMEGDLVP